jgi:hypothetical protein
MSNRKPPRRGDRETRPAGEMAVDRLIDEMGAQSFPASDPPAWGTVSSRLDQANRDAEQS